LNNGIYYDTLHQQDQQKDLVAKIAKKTKSEITAELSDPEMLGDFLNSVNSPLKKRRKSHFCSCQGKVQGGQESSPAECRTLCLVSPQ
jgi:hypothetical protein